MARGGILKASLDAHKGKNYALERQKKFRKRAEKQKRVHNEEQELEDDDEDDNQQENKLIKSNSVKKNMEDIEMGEDEEEDWVSEEEENEFDLAEIDDTDDSDSENEEDGEDDEEEGGVSLETNTNGTTTVSTHNGKAKVKALENEEDEDEDDDEVDEEDIPFSDLASLDSDDRGDLVPHQRLTINNGPALLSALARIAPPTATLPFSLHMTVNSTINTSSNIKDIDDDLSRELAFYAQSLEAVKQARQLLKNEGLPFTRPNDYFAEMVKSEEHMGRVKQRLVDDAASKKASSEARKQRDLKKFGKAVQVAKGQERDKLRRETMEKINSLKRKRSNGMPSTENEADMFDIALESETKRPKQSSNTAGKFSKPEPNRQRQKKNEKYGFGGKKRHAKSGDAMSSADMRDYSVKKMKGKAVGSKKRLGKSRRTNKR